MSNFRTGMNRLGIILGIFCPLILILVTLDEIESSEIPMVIVVCIGFGLAVFVAIKLIYWVISGFIKKEEV